MTLKQQNQDLIDEFKELLHGSEYDCQLFGFPAYVVYTGLKQMLFGKLKTGLKKMEKSLIKRCKDSNEQNTCKLIIAKLMQQYEESSGKCFYNLEYKLFAIFKIPNNILLEEDKVQSQQYTEEDVRKIDEEMEQLKLRYQRAICLQYLLKKESSFCQMEVIQKTVFEVEDSVNNCVNIFNHNKKFYDLKEEARLNKLRLLEQIMKMKQ